MAHDRTSKSAPSKAPLRTLGGVWSQVLLKAAGIACGMLVLAAIGALATARGLGEQQLALAESSPPATSSRKQAADSAVLGNGANRSLEAGLLTAPSLSPPSQASRATPAAEGPATPPEAAEGLTADGKVVLNRANIEQLRKLPGVGPKRAQAILDLRAKLGRFRRATDLLRIKGIGPKSLKKLQPHFVLDPPSSAPAS